MRNSKIRSGPWMIRRMCELLRSTGRKNPDVCDVAYLLDCDVRDVLREHARLDNPEGTVEFVPLLADNGRFADIEWHRADHPDHDAEKK